MTRIRRNLGLALALTLSAMPATAQQTEFDQGIDLLRRGRKEEALAAFQSMIASGLTNEQAYDLWRSSDDSRVWIDMMVEGGEYDLIARRFLDLAKLGRKERLNDEGAIQGLVTELRGTDDALERRRIIRKLSADHGEYAVPSLLSGLREVGDDDWRITAMTALKHMDNGVVPPLIAALDADDAFLRRNVAMTLGNIGDVRAAGVLEAMTGDSDSSVAAAAGEAAAACGSTGNAVDQLLQTGDDYHNRRDTVLRSYQYSDVVWSWNNGGLASTPVPRAIYNDLLAKQSYERALGVDANALSALSGIARAYVNIDAKISALAEAGADVGEFEAQADQAAMAVSVAGVDALDLALQWAVLTDDTATGTRLCMALAEVASEPTDGLVEAVQSSEGSLQGEAAVALGNAAWRGGHAADGTVVSSLGAAAGREIVRIVALIDARTERADALARNLGGNSVTVNHRGTGGAGIVMLHRLPGVDAILVGDGLTDMTLDQVLADIAGNDALANTPVFLVSNDPETTDLYGDRFAGTVADSADLSALDAVFEENLSGDRARAEGLAQRASKTLARLARAGQTDITSATAGLAACLATRGDAVILPAMGALGAAGGPDNIEALMAVATDSEHSDEARAAAANALGGIFSRYQLGAENGVGLRDLLGTDAAREIRLAAARALGRLQLAGSDRAALIGVAATLSE
ncbi:MAG: HEAT repeat protein [Chlamydiales bacterium]|jgi:HEAT repeat protein